MIVRDLQDSTESSTSYLNFLDHSQRVRFDVLECTSAKRTSRVVIFPCIDTLQMEVLLTSATIIKILSLLVHFREADDTIFVIFEVNILFLFASLHATFESVGELVIEDLVGGLTNLGCAVEEVENLQVLGDLCHDEIYVFAWFLLESKVHAGAGSYCRDFNMVMSQFGLCQQCGTPIT